LKGFLGAPFLFEGFYLAGLISEFPVGDADVDVEGGSLAAISLSTSSSE